MFTKMYLVSVSCIKMGTVQALLLHFGISECVCPYFKRLFSDLVEICFMISADNTLGFCEFKSA
jgi:hypothetical protein